VKSLTNSGIRYSEIGDYQQIKDLNKDKIDDYAVRLRNGTLRIILGL